MGSQTYLKGFEFEAQRFGRSYGDKPVFVLTSRTLTRTKPTVKFHSGDLQVFIDAQLKPTVKNNGVVGGAKLAGACVEVRTADEVRYSILPILIGKGISFFEELAKDISFHLVEVKAYRNGIVPLHRDQPLSKTLRRHRDRRILVHTRLACRRWTTSFSLKAKEWDGKILTRG